MKLSELKIIQRELVTLPQANPARRIVEREIAAIESKANHAQAAFAHYAPHFGLRPDQLGKTFVLKGRQYRITGLNPGAPRFAIECVRLPDNKPFRVPADCARNAA